jgi:LuxR family maltose regulon positive regulatory protein
MELSLSDRDIHTLEERTEGWIAGLQLAGLSIRNRINPSGFINTLSGSHRFILSYLTEEVLSRQTGDIQSFLLETSILEKLCPDLCDAVTGRNDGRLFLDQLENANLFLISLDDERRWYRYHHLFADLLGELLITHQKDKIDTLHSRASRWFAGAGMTSEAIQHALAATDYPAAVHLLEENAMQLLLQGYIKTMNGWMQSIPSEWGLDNPALNLILAWMHIIHGDFLQATPFVERLHALFSGDRFDQISDNTLKARWLALQALLMSNQSRPDNSLELAGRAMDLVPEGDVFDLSLVYMSLASAYRELDDYPRALQALQSIIQLGHDAGDFASELLGLSGLVQMALQHGKLRLAFETASQGIDLLNRTGVLPPISAAVYGALGDVYYQRNEPEKSLKYTERSAELGNLGGFSDAELYLHVTRSRLYQRQGDLDASSQQIHQAVDLMRVSAPAWDREGVVDQFVRVLLAQHHLAEAEKALESIKFTGDGQGSFSIENLTVPNPTAVQSMNLSARQFFNIALRILLYRGQNVSDQAGLDKGIELANSLIDAALQNQYLAIALEALLLRAQMHAVLGNRHAVLSDCAWAIELAEPEGFISIFVEEGPVIQQALQNLLENDLGGSVHSDYVNNILAACHASFQPVPGQPTSVLIPESGPVTTISGRELDVLRLMAAGFKYEEIAQKLFVSLNTVRSHVKAIYGKLNVNNRTRAIEIARQMGIL